MIKFENDCVDCGLPCLGNACPYTNVPHCYCDNCKDEVDDLYHYDGGHWCEECILSDCGKVDIDYD